ncbi:hypothetical protein [Oceanicoccus sp. KOV_DT_Chl]|uniref:hypothetical protein n=1 Tax=Oceanicoccus sp. KOV_DT_Chl TaxID=1904639 RepID=UPI000C7B4D8D|nr:hypothetical protein [Oceanicoccus sp. KOV_DT_Chl]
MFKLILQSIGIFILGTAVLAIIARFTFHGQYDEMTIVPKILIGILYCLPIVVSASYFVKGYKLTVAKK